CYRNPFCELHLTRPISSARNEHLIGDLFVLSSFSHMLFQLLFLLPLGKLTLPFFAGIKLFNLRQQHTGQSLHLVLWNPGTVVIYLFLFCQMVYLHNRFSYTYKEKAATYGGHKFCSIGRSFLPEPRVYTSRTSFGIRSRTATASA